MKKLGMKVMLGANTSAYNQKMRKSKGLVSQLSTQVMKFGAVMAGAFAVSKVANFMKSSIQGYDVQAKAEAGLLTALKGRVDIQKRLIEQASQLQRKTLFGDEKTIEAMGRLATMIGTDEQAIRKLMPLIQDMSTVMKMDLSAAADLVGKSIGSSTNALSRYGISIEGAVGSSERLESAVVSLTEKFEGQAETAAKVGTGSLTQLKNKWGDIKEEIGLRVIPVLNIVAGAILNIGQQMKLSGDLISDYKNNIIKERTQLELLFGALNRNEEGTKARKTAIEQINKIYGGYLTKLLNEKSGLDAIAKAYEEANKGLIKNITLKAKEQDLTVVLSQSLAAQKKIIDDIMADVKKQVGENIEPVALGNLYDILDKIIKSKDLEELKTLVGGFARSYRDADHNVGTYTKNLKQFIEIIKLQKKEQKELNSITLFYNQILKNLGSVDIAPDLSGYGKPQGTFEKMGAPPAMLQGLGAGLVQSMFPTAEGLETQLAPVTGVLEAHTAIWKDMLMSMQEPMGIVASAALQMGNAMMDAAVQGGASAMDMLRVVLHTARKIIAAYMAEGIAAAVSKGLKSAPFPWNIAVGAAAGGAAAALFNSLVSPLINSAGSRGGSGAGSYGGSGGYTPGGISNYNNWQTREGIDVHVTGELRGEDIYLANQKQEQRNNRF